MARQAQDRLRSERERAFERLYERHRGDVYRALRRDLSREDAEDASQTAFVNAYGALIRGGEPTSPRAWLLTIAENVRRRRFAADRPGVEVDDDELPAHEPEVTVHELRSALERLPSEQRQALLMRELGGLSYSEIADRQRTTVGSVQMLLFRARTRLREELGAARARVVGFPLPEWLQHFVANPGPAAVAGRVAGVAAAAAIAVVVATEAGVLAGSRPQAKPVAEESVPRELPAAGPASGATGAAEAWERSPAAAARRIRQAWPVARADAGAPSAARRAGDAAIGGSAPSLVPAPRPTVPTSPPVSSATPTVTLPSASVPAPTVPAPTVPAVPTVPAPAPTVPTPTVPTPTVPTPTVPAPTVPTPTVPELPVPTPTVPDASVTLPAVPELPPSPTLPASPSLPVAP